MQAIALSIPYKYTNLLSTIMRFPSLLLLSLLKPYSIGDYITFKEFSGFVEKITFQETTLKTVTNQTLVIPNHSIDVNWAFDLAFTRVANSRA